MLTFSRLIQFVLTGALALVITPALQAAPATQPQSAAEGCDAARSVHVTGTAVVNVTPDRALIRLGVQSNASSIDAVENANSAAIQKVIQAVIARGVEAKDISTDIYVVEPVYENYDSLFIKGYRSPAAFPIKIINDFATYAMYSIQRKSYMTPIIKMFHRFNKPQCTFLHRIRKQILSYMPSHRFLEDQRLILLNESTTTVHIPFVFIGFP